MTTTNATTDRATVAQVLAHLLVFQQQHKLPEVEAMSATTSNGIVSIDIDDQATFTGWADALECPAGDRSRYTYPDRTPINKAWTKRLGWSVYLTFVEPTMPAEVLPAETLAALVQVANGEAAPTFEPGELDAIAADPQTPVVDPSVFGPCNGLAQDSRDNTCTNFAAEYVQYPSEHVPFRDGEVIRGTNLRRLCTPCADLAPGRISRRPLTTTPNGYPVEAAEVTA